jgi:transcriptional regulator with XRE-family HTH domain
MRYSDRMTNNSAQLQSTHRVNANAIVAANVRAEIGRANISQSDLASALGENDMWLSRRLNSRPAFSTDEVQAIADYFNIKPGELFIEHRRPGNGGARKIVGITAAKSWKPLVGRMGLEPMTDGL